MLVIREACQQDYEAIALITTAIEPEPVTADEFAEADRRARQEGTLSRLVAEDEAGRVIGYGHAKSMPWFPAGRWGIQVEVHPDYRRHGAGTALCQAAERVAVDHGAAGLFGWLAGDDEESFAWAQGLGYAHELLRTEAVLDLADWAPGRFDDVAARVQASGDVRLELVDGDVSDALLRGIYDVDRLTTPDIPQDEPDTPFPSFESYQQTWRSETDPRLVAIAWAGGQVAGVSVVSYSAHPNKGAYTHFTGVLRQHRDRGIALALKALTIEAAAARGIPRMRTNNHFENQPMLAVNTRLGYRDVPGPRRVIKPADTLGQ